MVKKREAKPGVDARTEIPVMPGSGNVFADLGFAEPEEELTKAQLASHIRQIIRRRMRHYPALTLVVRRRI